MNRIEEVAKLLGVELNEEFRIEGHQNSYIITKVGLQLHDYIEDIDYDTYKNPIIILNGLILGTYKIIKKFIPKIGERYYYPVLSSEDLVNSTRYQDNCSYDKYIVENNMAFKTKEEAVEVTKKILDFLKDKDSV